MEINFGNMFRMKQHEKKEVKRRKWKTKLNGRVVTEKQMDTDI